MQLRDIARNVPVLSPNSLPPGWRSASEIPVTPANAGPMSALQAAMSRRQEMLAAKSEEGAMKQLEAQAELEEAQLEIERLEAKAKLDDLRAEIASRRQQPSESGGGVMDFMLKQAAEREAALQATVSQLQSQQFEAQQRMIEQLSSQMKEIRSGSAEGAKPKGVIETITEAISLKEALDALGGGSKGGVSHADVMKEMELRHDIRMRELEFQRQGAHGDAEMKLAEQKLKIEQMRYNKLADTIDEAAPTFMALVGSVLGAETPEPEVSSLDMAIPVRCGGCHEVFGAPQGWESGVNCPRCGVLNGAQPEPPPPPPADEETHVAPPVESATLV